MNTGLEYNLALRMRSATRWVEGQQGMLSDEGDGAVDGFGRAMLVRTGALPSPYTGAEGVAGTTIDQQPTGANVAGVAIWIKDLNGGMLAANTTYSARLGGYLTQSILVNGITTPSNRSLYLVARIPTPEAHFYPRVISGLSNANTMISNGIKYHFIFRQFGSGIAFGVIIINGSPLSALSTQAEPRLFLRNTGRLVQGYYVYDWYHVAQMLYFPVVFKGQVGNPGSNIYGVFASDPAPILETTTSEVSCTCMWEIFTFDEPNSYTGGTFNIERLWIIGRKPPTTSTTLGAPLGAPLGG